MKGKYIILNLIGMLITVVSSMALIYSHNPYWVAGLGVSGFIFGHLGWGQLKENEI
jgi:hypothetical protein